MAKVYKDLREFLKTLEEEGQLIRVKDEVDPEPDIGAAGRACANMDKKPAVGVDAELGSSQLKQHGWQQGLMPEQALERVDRQLSSVEKRLQALERCVTSREFQARHP